MKRTILITLEVEVEDNPQSEGDRKLQEGLQPEEPWTEETPDPGPETIDGVSAHSFAETFKSMVYNEEAWAGTDIFAKFNSIKVKSAIFYPRPYTHGEFVSAYTNTFK